MIILASWFLSGLLGAILLYLIRRHNFEEAMERYQRGTYGWTDGTRRYRDDTKVYCGLVLLTGWVALGAVLLIALIRALGRAAEWLMDRDGVIK